MRFISKYGRFGVQIMPLVQEAYATGLTKVIQPAVYAMFMPYRLTPTEREMALARWTFNGLYQEQDEVTIVQPDYRIGLFDSEEAQFEHNWSDDIRRQVEDALCDLAERFDDIIVVRVIALPPWPRYDEFRGTPAALVRRCIEDGYELTDVLAYEQQSQARPRVIEEFEKAIAAPQLGSDGEPLGEEVVIG